MSNGYLHIDSTYRDRNLWPKAGEFEIPLSQTGDKCKTNSLDPVSFAEPLVYWTADYLKNSGNIVSNKIEGYIEPLTTGGGKIGTPLASSSDGTSFALIITGTVSPQTQDNYYTGLIFHDTTTGEFSRILTYKFVGGLYQPPPAYLWRCLITVSTSLANFAYGDNFEIIDPTDFTVVDYPLLFVPNGRSQANAYLNYVLYWENQNIYRNITFYDNLHRIISCEPFAEDNIPDVTTIQNFSIRKIPPIFPTYDEDNIEINNDSTFTTINVTVGISSLQKEQDYYKYSFLRLKPNYQTGYTSSVLSQSRQIISYIYDEGTDIVTFIVYTPFNSNTFTVITGANYWIEIEEFSKDNFNPFVYAGTLVQQASCYEFELVNLVLPNYTLSSGFGSKIAFYPYVYVELSNVSAANSHLRNIISSNNPNCVKMIFTIPIYDVQDPETTPFVRLISSNMIQTIKFKPDDNLFFRVLLPNGDVFNTVLPVYFSPSEPNPNNQVSALFRYKRVN